MKKILISMMACSMIITGCGSKQKKSVASTTAQVTTQSTVKNNQITKEDLELLFEQDEYKQLKTEYEISEYKNIDEDNVDSLLSKIDKAFNKNKEIIIAVGLGIVVIAGVAYVLYNPAVAATIVTHISTLMQNESVKTAIKLIESGTLYSFIEYCKTKDIKKSIQNGSNYTLNKLQKIVCDLI